MIINFGKPIYETIWTGDVDRILAYDTKNYAYLVEDVTTGKQRTHMTTLSLKNLSTSNIKHSRENRKEIKEYLDSFKIKGIYNRY